MAVVKGKYKLLVSARGYAPFVLMLSVSSDTHVTISLSPALQMTVDAKLDELPNDPTAQVYRTEDLLPADQGLPGQALSIPGPSETASGGVKAPQYFSLVTMVNLLLSTYK